MKYSAIHPYPCTPRQLVDVLDDPELEQRLATITNMSREVLELSTTATTRRKRVRCRPNREIPGFVKRAIGEHGLQYDEINDTDLDTCTVRWHVELPVLNDRVTIGGITHITATEGGCQRAMQGEFSVHVRLIGSRIEAITVPDIQKSYEAAAQEILRFVREKHG